MNLLWNQTFNKDHLHAASHEAPIVKKRKMEENVFDNFYPVLWKYLFSFLSAKDLCYASGVNKKFKKYANDEMASDSTNSFPLHFSSLKPILLKL